MLSPGSDSDSEETTLPSKPVGRNRSSSSQPVNSARRKRRGLKNSDTVTSLAAQVQSSASLAARSSAATNGHNTSTYEGGSEADESALTLDEASFHPVARKKSSTLLLPFSLCQSLTVTLTVNTATAARRKSSKASQPVAEPPTSSASNFDRDFDFASGLQSFNKHAVFAQIRDADTTDPAARLVSHNRLPSRLDRYTTKLGIHESVLDPGEMAESELDTMASSALPETSATETEEEMDAQNEDTFGGGLVTADGLAVPVFSWKEWRELQQLANIELGMSSNLS